MNESDIEEFWNRHPCGDFQVGGLDAYANDYSAFFSDYDSFRYHNEPHILACLDGINFKGKRVLEIGLGQGADSEQIIRRGGIWSGLDLTAESVARVLARLRLRRLPYEVLQRGSVLDMPFEDGQFDLVYAHGVLHHVPDIKAAQKEIARVLKADGELICMLYAKWSLNYLLSIKMVRRFGLAVLLLCNRDPGGIYGAHMTNARAIGVLRYLRMKNFVHKNTDGPFNPYSSVYSIFDVRRNFPDFEVLRSYKRYMHAPPLQVGWMPLSRVLGWHLWVHMVPRLTTKS